MTHSSIFDRLLLWHKFAIVSAVAIVLAIVPATLYIRDSGQRLDALVLESQSRQPVATILKTIQLTQQHRGLAALVLGGLDDMAGKRDDKQREADQLYQTMDAVVRDIGDTDIGAAWSAASADWASLRGKVAARSITVPDSYAAHVALIVKLLRVEDLVADHFGLNLDPNLDTYQLIQTSYYSLPYLSEELGRMRAAGAALLAAQHASGDERAALSGIVARVADRLSQTMRQFDKSVRANPAIGERLGTAVHEVTTQAEQAMQLAGGQIVQPETFTLAAPEYVRVTTAAIDAQYAFAAAATAQLDDLVDQKTAALRRQRVLVLGTLAAMFALGGVLLVLIAHSVTGPLNNAVEIAERVAAGDLTAAIDSAGRSETARLLAALRTMNGNLRRIVSDVRSSVHAIGAATGDIASGNANLSSRTESQASSLEETASSMEQMTATVQQNADNAQQANTLAATASDIAVKGGSVVADVVQTMGAIHDSARRVSDIIGVIDGIAFQTNILALNAAVEAARAGEQGRGFAVVASEVRNLAQRSAAAAKEIKQLINESVERVDVGNRQVAQAGASMRDIVDSIRRVSDIVAEIVVASQEQASGIQQVNATIIHLDDTTQQNSALVEEAAAASASLNEQARALMQAMGVFTLGSEPAADKRAPGQDRRPALRAA
jgi:methyl-accepting chemotaxis protein